jgi:tRNA(His) 5'-end guanylyltransferase
MVKDSLGDRMKANYEDRFRFELPRRMPCIIRLDGKAFHTFTRAFDRPFDEKLLDAMNYAAENLAAQVQGFKMAYLQSDECSILLTDYDQIETEAWFNYNKSKMETIAASVFTAFFNLRIQELLPDMLGGELAFFDARAFSIPREDVANYFLWRAKDWERNSLSMYCRSFFSAKQLHGKNRQAQHDMLHAEGKNWATDLPARWRNGSWLINSDTGLVTNHDIQPVFSQINSVTEPLLRERPQNEDSPNPSRSVQA